jgi:hypothetical protein
MFEVDGRRMHRRITGRQALERRARALLLAVHRFASCRAPTLQDVGWCARAIDALNALLDASQPIVEPGPGQPRTRWEGEAGS